MFGSSGAPIGFDVLGVTVMGVGIVGLVVVEIADGLPRGTVGATEEGAGVVGDVGEGDGLLVS